MQLFYSSNIDESSREYVFDKNESRHIIRVLRKKLGDVVQITDGLGTLFEGEITNANDKRCAVNITKHSCFQKPWNYYLHIAIAPTKNNDRFEWFLEKATEIGIDEITPIICERSERKVIKLGRLEKIIQSASKQSLKYHFPKLNAPVLFREFITSSFNGSLFIAHCENMQQQSLKSQLLKGVDTTLLIGPEGDFSMREIETALASNFKPVSLGKSRLRTETAGLVAVHSVAFTNE